MRYCVLLVTLLSFFWLPWQLTVLLMIVSSVFFPLAGVVFGVLFDVIYAPVGFVDVPLGIVWGAAATMLGYGIERFIRARIMSV